jgi:predicted PurR-regulated permease PerM
MTSGSSSDNSISNQNQPAQNAPSKDATLIDTSLEKKRTLVSRTVLVIMMVAVLFVFVPMLKIFLTPLVLACTFTSLFFPLYTMLMKFFRGNRGLSSLSCCIILVLGFVVPAYFLGYLVTHQVLNLYQSIEPSLQALIRGENTGFLSRFKGHQLTAWLAQFDFNWQSTVLDGLKTAGATMAKMVNKTSLGALEIIIGLFATLFIMFYLFMDGERIVTKFRQLLPMRKEYQDMIIARFLLVSRATIKGTLVIAIIQGSLGAIILLCFGIKSWLLWGVLMVTLALIPMMGAWLVLVPAGIIQIATGNLWQGIVILALSFGVVSTIDNILRPRLVGQSARMHDLLIFFSTIGGLAMFGPIGVITGPVIMAFFVSITEIYAMELRAHLGEVKRD